MKNEKKKYTKPAFLHRGKVEVFAAVCNSTWSGNKTCRIIGQSGCIKTRI